MTKKKFIPLCGKMIQNESEVQKLNKVIMDRADKILDEFGAEGAYKMARFLQMIADKDIGKI